MLRIASAILLLGLLSACAHDVELTGEEAVPVCASDSECNAMWNGARAWLRRNMSFDLYIDREDRLQTFRAEDDPNLWGIVEKVPLGDGRYRIEATIRCGTVGRCDPSAWKAFLDFNRTVNRSYITFD